jgi:DNA invertase Pin-like site-specific DNA recombinase
VASRNKYKIIRSYCDDGISGHYAAKRPNFLSMIEDISAEKYEVKALLIWDSYRFVRNMVEFLTYKQMIRQHGIAVIAISELQV